MKKNETVRLSSEVHTLGSHFKMSYEMPHQYNHIYILNSEIPTIYEGKPSGNSQPDEDCTVADEDLLMIVG